MISWKKTSGLLMVLSLVVGIAKLQAAEVITTTIDDVTVYGETYFEGLDATAPLILLFHQARSNGRGEYAELANWLNAEGYRVIAWDQRSGGNTYGESNRTNQGLQKGIKKGNCDAYPDLQAALEYSLEQGLADKVFIVGSSYSAALVVQLAAKNIESVSGVVAFSPAAGGSMAKCRARDWIEQVQAPVFVLRPDSEMKRQSSQRQRDIFTSSGARFHIVEDGVHGASMLVDSRTKKDMHESRALVVQWLNNLSR